MWHSSKQSNFKDLGLRYETSDSSFQGRSHTRSSMPYITSIRSSDEFNQSNAENQIPDHNMIA